MAEEVEVGIQVEVEDGTGGVQEDEEEGATQDDDGTASSVTHSPP